MQTCRHALAALILVTLAASPVGALDSESLRLLLLGAQDMNTPQVLTRADLTISTKGHEATRKTRAIAFFAPGKDARWYLQLKMPPLQALVLGEDRKVMQRVGDKTETLPISTAIADLGITYEDLSRFIADDFKFWQITDENPTSILVGAHPGVESAYVYRAYRFDKERKVPQRIQFYAETLNNLVKLRRDDEHVLVGRKWFPGRISVENYTDETTTTLEARWSQSEALPPEYLAPVSFADTEPLAWPSPAPASTSTPSPAPASTSTPIPAPASAPSPAPKPDAATP